MPRRYLAIIEEPRVTETIGEAHASYSRFHDLYDGLTWRLCRDPAPGEAKEIAPETFLIKSESWEYPGFCAIYLVYTVDDGTETITIEDLWVEDVGRPKTTNT